jgi:predicted aspartyl protease
MNDTKTYYAFEQRYPFQTEYLISEVEVYSDPTENPEKSERIRAKWDTGANHTVISIELMKRLNLIPIDSEVISGVGGSQVIDVVRLAVKLPNDLFISSKHIGVCTINSAQKIDILIGMDIIQHGDYHISNTGGKTRFSFVMPSLPTPYSLAEEADKLNEQIS